MRSLVDEGSVHELVLRKGKTLASPAANKAMSMPRVLVIDDDPTLRRMLSLGLTIAGHEVREASDGLEGLRALEQESADVVLCDLYMPRQDGMQTLRELRQAWPDVPTIAMSGGPASIAPGHDYLSLTPHLGARAVLQKPFGVRDAVRVVDRVLAELEPRMQAT